MVANTWIAAAPGDWSDDANWSLGHSPIAGEDPTFDGTSVNNCNANDDTPTGVLTIAAGYSGTITQSSDMYISEYSQAGGTFTGVITKWVYCSGDTYFNGTLAQQKLQLCLSGTNKILSSTVNGNSISSLNITGIITLTGNSFYIDKNLVVSGKLIIDSGNVLRTYTLTNDFQIEGEITGTGTVQINVYGVDKQYTLTNINCPINFNLMSGASSKIISKSDINCTSVSIYSTSATYICTLDLNGHSLTATSITVGTRGILQCGEGTITTSALTSTAGTIIEETATWIFERGSTIKVAAGQKMYNVIAKGSSALKLLSNLGISELFAHPAEIDRNGFTLTLDQPDKEYAGLRRPIIVPVKKLDIGEVGLLDSWLRDLGGLL